MSELKLSLKRKECPVTLQDESGNDRQYTLRELTGKARDEFMSLVSAKVRFGADGKPQGVRDSSGLQSQLVCRSLFDDHNDPVKRDIIENWPASVQDALFKKAQELSALSSEGAEDVGNGSRASASNGSD